MDICYHIRAARSVNESRLLFEYMAMRTRSDQGSGLRCREWVRERRRARSRPDSPDALLRLGCPVHPSISPGPSQPPRRSAVSHSSHYRSATKLSCAFGRQTTVSARCSLALEPARAGRRDVQARVSCTHSYWQLRTRARSPSRRPRSQSHSDIRCRTHARAAERAHWHARERIVPPLVRVGRSIARREARWPPVQLD